jgi:hypothetical protein
MSASCVDLFEQLIGEKTITDICSVRSINNRLQVVVQNKMLFM